MSDRVDSRGEFGPNAWLIDEMYQSFLADPASVAEAWREFFEDYEPSVGAPGQRSAPERPGVPPPPPPPSSRGTTPEGAELRGAAGALVRNMKASLEIPTATSIRTVPAKLLELNRRIINRQMARGGGGKIAFGHLISWAVVKAAAASPAMRTTYVETDGTARAVTRPAVDLGIAVDVERKDGSRSLLVPVIKDAHSLGFAAFTSTYDEMVGKARAGRLEADEMSGAVVTVTNPGTLGTSASVARLMPGQAAIVGVGAIEFPAEFHGADPQTLGNLAIGKIVNITSTYDHRVIQGAESGAFLGHVHALLIGEEGFYEEIFGELEVPYVPVAWKQDANPSGELEAGEKLGRVMRLINMYRVRGHLIADLDPLRQGPVEIHPELDPAAYGLTIWDLDRRFPTGGLAGSRSMTLGSILAVLRDAYCRTAGIEYMHIQDPAQKYWIRERVEGVHQGLEREAQLRILRKLGEAEAFERFLHTKYTGHKRFSLEGAESLIPILDTICALAADTGMTEAVIGMSHRGRLNVLANLVGKSYGQIFRQFEGDIDPEGPHGSGDVKYHVGAAGKYTSPAGNELLLAVASNPSHLESVDPVVEGMTRAKQDQSGAGATARVLPLLIHGEAAFAGQGVAAETLALSQLPGFTTGGTIHVIVNNQLGFTTGSTYARSSTYASDVAKVVQAPIFHVNGDDPEACVNMSKLAFDFRARFGRDVVIDMWCYRRWGHNEADEPAFTQPLMYEAIAGRRSPRKRYTETLVRRGDISLEEAEAALVEFRATLEQALAETRGGSRPASVTWKKPAPMPSSPIPTGVARPVLERVLAALTTVPEGFTLHPKLARWLESRARALDDDAVDWSLAEALAFGSLLTEGITVRLSGEDTRRGTFSQRHAVLVDQRNAAEYAPLSALEEGSARFHVHDSLLSEFAVLGFEYGYSTANPDALVAWEAQFGDFANGAQVIIDNYVAAAEDKWGQTSRLVMLLPHGYEGQGPEHSSARIERFLQLCAEDNLQVAVPSTAAQYFHLLRRQVHTAVAKPLVVATPKSLLRLPGARSAAGDFLEGHFQPVLGSPLEGARRLILCQGKVYYELAARMQARPAEDVALVRLEQPYPFPAEALEAELGRHPRAEVLWVQEEPLNMGAAWHVERSFRHLGSDLRVVARGASSSPASGSLLVHQIEQAALLDRAFEGL